MRNPKHVNSLHVKHIDMTIKEGDTVLLRPSKPRQPLWIAKIDKIDNGRFSAKWYFRPEETRLGRRIFNGANEVYSSDYCDTQSPETIERKCMVHNDKKYTELCYVGEDDFFCRFKYYADPPMLMPKRVPVFCKCEMPNNPDEFMVRCNKCSEWFHPSCIEMTRETAEQLPHFYCDGCDSQPQELPKGLQEDLIHVTRDDQDTVPVSHKDLKCLDPSEYLSSEIMNFYISFLQRQPSTSQISADCHFFNTFFYKKVTDTITEKGDIVRLRRWWEGINLFSKAYIFIPIHDAHHWSLVIVCIPDKENEFGLTILHLDSLEFHSTRSIVDNVKWWDTSSVIFSIQKRTSNYHGLKMQTPYSLYSARTCFRLLIHEWKYLTQDGYSEGKKKKKKKQDGISLNLPVSEKVWSNLPSMVNVADVQVPQQINGFDCGVYVLLFIERFIKEAPQRLNMKNLAMFNRTWFTPDAAVALRTKIRNILIDLFRVGNQTDTGIDVREKEQPMESDKEEQQHKRKKKKKSSLRI